MIPDGRLSTTTVAGPLLAPDDRVRESLTIDYELGGIALNDPSQGLRVQVWDAALEGDDVVLRAETTGFESVLFTVPDITELSLSFDQNMRPAVAYVAGGSTFLYWFDTLVNAQVTTPLPEVTSPFITQDDKRDNATLTGRNDLLLFYVRDATLYYRQQRDRFTIEYPLAEVPAEQLLILAAGMGRNGRVQVQLADDLGPDVYSAVHPALLDDTLYGVVLGVVRPLFRGDHLPAEWRSKIIVDANHPGFSWLRVNGDLGGVVNVSVYGDGELFYAFPAITTRTPVRMPAKRFRKWEVLVESRVRITSVTLATSAAELVPT